MSLTITINEAVPATLTIGVGTPGATGPAGATGPGVAVGGTTGQVLQKLSATNYDTGWATPAADFITAVTAPLAVTSGNLSVNLSAYQTLAGMSSYLTTSTAASTYQTLAGMSSYLTTSTAASTYAITSRGQPVSGTVGQVLTKNSGTNYDSSWSTLIPGDRYLTTSSTSNAVSNGNKTFTVGTGLSYTTQQDVTIAYDAAHHMHGLVLTYNSGTGVMTVDVNSHTGTGTYTSWVVNVGGTVPLASIAWGDITGTLGNQTDLATALNNKLEVSTAASTYTTFGYTASTYFLLAGGALNLNTNITASNTSDSDSEMAGFGFGVQKSSDHTKGTTVEFDGLDTYDGASHMNVNPTGLTFPDATTQTTSATNLGYISQGTADGLYYSISNPNGFTNNTFDGTSAIQAVSGNSASSVTAGPTSSGQYLKYNGSNLEWDTPGGGGGVAWGAITGNLYDQTDLQGVLDSKYSTSNPSGFTNFSGMDAISAITGGYTSSIAGGATISGQVLTYNGSQITWVSNGSPYTNSVWAYGNWYSANVTGIYDGYMNYYTVLTF